MLIIFISAVLCGTREIKLHLPAYQVSRVWHCLVLSAWQELLIDNWPQPARKQVETA